MLSAFPQAMKQMLRENLIRIGCLSLVISGHLSFGQAPVTKSWLLQGKFDSELKRPILAGKMGQRDTSALNEIRQYVQLTTPQAWPGMEGVGDLYVGYGNAIHQVQANLTLETDGRYRLESDSGNNEGSVRASGYVTATRDIKGNISYHPRNSLLNPFFVPSDLLFVINDKAAYVADGGYVTVEGVKLHEITVGIPKSELNPKVLNQSSKIDLVALYFNPSTHLLVKKASVETYGGNHLHEYFLVVSYNDYRSSDDATVPFTVMQTINGQHSMTFKASKLSRTSGHQASYFHF